ncbi:cupin domain-containing protein [Serratia proteamaculans]|jgi:quercetin dioxygenase-like cupin family protein|uniref:cupin domain-containing protein n=1 Tax=Serratia proteamaculans TaxID=28151 RepID=UPI0021788147|nr:cupin domain-containing protein [Serratia proteamaculans]CAI1574985.1 Cupin [Serratia proteamaculans]CAI2463004.1 Cupin [Serratia proteamaculans]
MSDDDNKSDQHQRVHKIRQGDIIEVPAGAKHWDYDNGESPLIVVAPGEEGSEQQDKE